MWMLAFLSSLVRNAMISPRFGELQRYQAESISTRSPGTRVGSNEPSSTTTQQQKNQENAAARSIAAITSRIHTYVERIFYL